MVTRDRSRIAGAALPGDQARLQRRESWSDITCLAWHPQIDVLACGTRHGSVQLWDARSIRVLRYLGGHRGEVRSVTWSADGTRLATTCADPTTRIWDLTDVRTGALASLLVRSRLGTAPVAWQPHGPLFAEWGDHPVIYLRDGTTGRIVNSLIDHKKAVLAVAWSPDGRFLASGGADGVVKVWNAAEGRVVWSVKVRRGEVRSLAWSPDEGRLAAALPGQVPNSVRLWNGTTGERWGDIGSVDVGVIAWSDDGRLATVTTSGRLRLVPMTVEHHPGAPVDLEHEVTSVSWSPDGRRLATLELRHTRVGSATAARVWAVGKRADGRLRVQTAGTLGPTARGATTPGAAAPAPNDLPGVERRRGTGHRPVGSLSWSPDSAHMVVTCAPGPGLVYRVGTAESGAPSAAEGLGRAEARHVRLARRLGVAQPAWSPGGDHLAYVTVSDQLVVWEASTDTADVLDHLDVSRSDEIGWSTGAAPRLAFVRRDRGEIWAWNGAQRRSAAVGVRPMYDADMVAWSPDLTAAIVVSRPRALVWLWPVGSSDVGSPVVRGTEATNIIGTEWSADGRFVAVRIRGRTTGTDLIWDVHAADVAASFARDEPGAWFDGSF